MWFFNNQSIPKVSRNFSPAYFSDPDTQQTFEELGYVVLRQIVTPEELEEGTRFFQQLEQLDAYRVEKKFESTGNFPCKDTQMKVFDFLEKFTGKIARRFANLENCDLGDGGAFFIKPNTPESTLHPHQDSAVIDESKYYGVFVWIPFTDITLENGPLYVLPKSHLWGNFYRSQHIPWAFRKEYKYLWEKMIPLPVNRGDIICFDTSIIHASDANRSGQVRVAAAGALLPKNHKKIEYLLKGKHIYQYQIDNNYWLDGGQEATLKNYPYELLPYAFPNPVSKTGINEMINQHS